MDRFRCLSLLLRVYVLFALLAPCVPYRPYPDPGPDLGPPSGYCGRRARLQCCPGRDDYCTAPILDTHCYCDIFCNRSVADCCPDFWRLCLGVEPPPGAWSLPAPHNPGIENNCYHEGALHKEGAQIFPNCNNCTCVHVADKHEYNWNCTQHVCLVQEEILSTVNGGQFGWRAKNYTAFWGRALADGMTYRLGTLRPMKYTREMKSIKLMMEEKEESNLPAEFDARKQWPGLVHGPQDQGECGASWAFSTTSVASDRLAIHSSGLFTELLSAQHLLDCHHDYMQHGCQGGHLDRAWWFMRRTGVASVSCYPYHSGESGEPGRCRAPLKYSYTTGAQMSCAPGAAVERGRLYQASPPYRIAQDEHEIMQEIFENGPVQATLEVHEDFFSYSSGVYRYSTANGLLPHSHRSTGYHSVKIIGWGVDTSRKMPIHYWLCVNSWGSWWGEGGTFHILRGSNECQIEAFVLGVWGKVNGRQIARMHNDQAHV